MYSMYLGPIEGTISRIECPVTSKRIKSFRQSLRNTYYYAMGFHCTCTRVCIMGFIKHLYTCTFSKAKYLMGKSLLKVHVNKCFIKPIIHTRVHVQWNP